MVKKILDLQPTRFQAGRLYPNSCLKNLGVGLNKHVFGCAKELHPDVAAVWASIVFFGKIFKKPETCFGNIFRQ